MLINVKFRNRYWLRLMSTRSRSTRVYEREEFVSLLFTFSFTHGFDRFGIKRPATEAIGTRVSRGPVSYGHGQGTAGIAFVALLDQLRARLRHRYELISEFSGF